MTETPNLKLKLTPTSDDEITKFQEWRKRIDTENTESEGLSNFQIIDKAVGEINQKISENTTQIATTETKVTQIETEIEPLEDKEIDELWEQTGVLPTVAMPKEMKFRYYKVPANTQFFISRDASYMVFCGTASLKLYNSSDGAVIPNENDSIDYAKQMQLITATYDSNPTSSSFAVGGMFVGSSILQSTAVDRDADEGSYIIGTAAFRVYEMRLGD